MKVPGRIVQKRAGLQTFEATVTSATREPGKSHRAADAAGPGRPGRRRRRGGRACVETQRLADGVFRITGGYVALAVDMGDHIVVLEGPQNEARALAVIAAAKQAIPNKPIRFVVNTHPHFDHAGGLAPFVAEGATILTHENNERFLERALAAPRRLVGDTLAKSNRKPNVEGVGDRRVLRGGEPHHRAASRGEPSALGRDADELSAEREDPLHGGLRDSESRRARRRP